MNDNEAIKPAKFEPVTATASKPAISIRKGSIAIASLLVFFSAIAWFLLTAKAVYIDTNPKESSINIDGGLQFKLADRYLLRPGEYELDISQEGYYPLEQELNVSDEQNQRYTFQLQRLPGHLQVNTGNVSGAEIFVDGTSKGFSPTLIRDLPHGERQLRVSAERYFPAEETVLIEGLDKEQSLDIQLSPAWADISFSSEPASAEVFNNGELIGKTPLTAEIMEGKHDIRVRLSGYKEWQDDIDVVANKAMRFDDIKLELADAVIFLISNPPRANITLDGQYKGLTPLEIALEPDKESTIRLFKEGFKPTSKKITAASGDQQHLNVKLQPELVAVEFNVAPKDARLYVNGKLRGKANQTLRLSAKTHRIEVKKDGYVSYKSNITPHTGIAQKVNISLKTLRQAQLEKVKPLITTSGGQRMKLFYPNAFTMGASRREPGRRANETLRDIQLKRPFYLGLHEVTNAQYKAFAKDHSSGRVQGTNLDGDEQPAVQMTWEQAALYCNWLSKRDSLPPFYKEKDNKIVGVNSVNTGYRLPSEAEWAWAARTTNGSSLLKFPWGPQMPPPDKSGNYADESAGGILGKIIRNYQDNYPASAPIGSFTANSKGLFDMGGNVAEWTHDFYDIALNQGNKTPVDPLGPKSGKFHVIRGSSWAHGTITELRLSYRDYNEKPRDDVGFRIARYLE